MPTNPQVNKQLKAVTDLEVKRLIYSTYRYNSVSGRGISDAVRYEKSTGDQIFKNVSIENGDIDAKRAVVAFTELFPDFDKECLTYLSQIPEDQRTAREVFHRLAIYLSENLLDISDDKRRTFFDLIEVILSQGTAELKYSIGNSFLEDLQNILGNSGQNPEEYVPYLGPETQRWWKEINRFWDDLEQYFMDK